MKNNMKRKGKQAITFANRDVIKLKYYSIYLCLFYNSGINLVLTMSVRDNHKNVNVTYKLNTYYH